MKQYSMRMDTENGLPIFFLNDRCVSAAVPLALLRSYSNSDRNLKGFVFFQCFSNNYNSRLLVQR